MSGFRRVEERWVPRKKTFVSDGGEFLALGVAVSFPGTALGRLKDNSVLIAKGLKSLSSLQSPLRSRLYITLYATSSLVSAAP